MYNKKRFISVYLLIFIMVFGINIDRVSAIGGSASGGHSFPNTFTSTGGYSGSNSHSIGVVATGYRVSLQNSKGMVSGTYSIDYWPEIDNYNSDFCIGFKAVLDSSYCVNMNAAVINKWKRFEKKMPKNLFSKSSIITGKYNNTYEEWDFIVKKTSVENNRRVDNYNQYGIWTAKQGGSKGDIYYNNNYAFYAYDELRKIIVKDKHSDSDYKKIAKLLRNSNYKVTSDDKDLVENAAREEIYISIEPVIAMTNENHLGHIGTPTELYKLDLLNDSYYDWAFPYYSYLYPCIYTKSSSGNNILGVKACNDVANGSGRSNYFEKDNCLGIAFIKLSDGFESASCEKEADDLLKKTNYSDMNKFVNDLKTKLGTAWIESDYDWMFNYDKYGFSDSTFKDYVKKSCKLDCNYVLSTNFNGRDISSSEGSYIKTMIKNYNTEQKNSFAFNKWNGGAYDYILNYELYYGKKLSNNSSYDATYKNVGNLCLVNTCTNLLKPESWDQADKIFPFFTDYLELDRSFSDVLDSPRCGNDIPTCPPSNPTTVSCTNDKKSFHLTDSENINGCIKTGRAYTDSSGKNLQSSEETEYTINDKERGYCQEDIEINLPGNPDIVKAGRLLKWGYKVDDGAIYGYMHMTRNCYLPNNTKIITYNWLDKLNPQFSLYYKEAASKDVFEKYDLKTIDGEKLKVDLDSMYIRTGNNEYKWLTKDEISAKKVSFKKSFSETTFKLHWNIVYGDNFKWYSNKDVNKKEDYLDYEHNQDKITTDNYTLIGYGLPTTFLAPTGLKGNYHYNYSADSTDGKGYLELAISNIGTKNNGEGYHFDNYLKFNLTDDIDSKPNNSKKEIYYSCNYSIYNELFGYEDGHTCGDNGESCDTPEGLDVVFRPIELINTDGDIDEQIARAFPGKAGKGRERGRNWADLSNETLESILNNNVYDNEPMYHIELNTSLIQRIRQDNKTVRDAKEDPYTYMGTNDDYGYECFSIKDSDYDFCTSNYLNKLQEDKKLTFNGDWREKSSYYIYYMNNIDKE